MPTHPVDEIAASQPAVAQRLLLAPVRCVDCDTYVPLGWVEYGTVKCPQNIGANGVRYGHRAGNDTITHVKDTIYNS